MRTVSFQNHLQELRRQRGLSQRELARMAGLPHPVISYIETGGRIPTFPTMKRIASALEVEVSDIFS